MKLKFFKPQPKLIASISKIGVLTFHRETINQLRITKNSTFDFGVNEENSKDTAIYFVIYEKGEGCFKASRCGVYLTLRIKHFLTTIGAAEIKKPVYYNINKIEYQGQPAFKMTLA